MRSHKLMFTVSLTGISRAMALRDLMLGRNVAWRRARAWDVSISWHQIPGGKNLLDAALVKPANGQVKSVLLICHGIGETVDGWLPVQQLLAANGTASLVFDYSGYGRSRGRVDAAQFEEDAVAAFGYLQGLMPEFPIAMLGFSLGSGIAAAVINRVKASHLILCAAFTSFRAAACSAGVPSRYERFVPPLWRAKESLCNCPVPVLVVHGERDRMFPVRMAEEIAGFCEPNAALRIVPKVGHNEPFRRPRLAYWGVILEWLEAGSGAEIN